MNISVTTDVSQEQSVKELRARRNLLVHNRGLVNTKYLEETGANLKLGEPVPIQLEYLEDAFYLLCTVISQVDRQAVEKKDTANQQTLDIELARANSAPVVPAFGSGEGGLTWWPPVFVSHTRSTRQAW